MSATVELSNGVVRGARAGDLDVFRGIPYAQPPVGDLRFRAPVPLERWPGIRDATAFGPACLQPTDFVGTLLGFAPQPASEDCLTLNVWTPACDGGARPVLVWIHGGAFVVASGSRELTDPTALVRRGDVVVVTLNYRLGAFGFLYLGAHGGDAIGAIPNVGLLDQIAALQWVRREIAAFGGDPTRITVFGESAGAISIATLLALPAAGGAFDAAILQSGAPNLVAPPDRAARVAGAVLSDLGIAAGELGAIRRVSAERLLAAEIRVLAAPPPDTGALPFQPAIDGAVLPDDPFVRIAAGSAGAIPLLVGTTLDEMKLFDLFEPKARALDDAGLQRRCEQVLGAERGAAAIACYRAARAERGWSTAPPELWNAIDSDRVFRAPAMRLAAIHAARGAAVYAYLFTWPSPYMGGALGACHALDIPFTFGTLDDPHILPFAGNDADAHALARRMQDAWAAFARRGDPSHAGLPQWPPYAPPRRATMVLGRECGVVDAPYEAERAFWG
jgi:para-nitrobenzyl esterase